MASILDDPRYPNLHNLLLTGAQLIEKAQKKARVPPGLRIRASSGMDFSWLNQCAACPAVTMSTLLLGMKDKSSAVATLYSIGGFPSFAGGI